MKQPTVWPSETVKLKSGCGSIYMTIIFNEKKSKITRVIIYSGKQGGCASAQLTSISGQINDSLSYGRSTRLKSFSKLTGTSCHAKNCCIDKVGRYLLEKELMFASKGGD